MKKVILLSFLAALALPASSRANAATLEPIGDHMAQKFDVKWQNDGFIYTLENLKPIQVAANTTLPLNGVKAKAYTDQPLNQPLMHFGGIYDGPNVLQGISAISVLFGMANACQEYKDPGFSDYLDGALHNLNNSGQYSFSKTLNGAKYQFIGKKTGNNYHLDISMRYPEGTQPKCAFSKYAKPPIPATGDLRGLPPTGKVEGPRQANPLEASEANRYARRLTGKVCTAPIVIRNYRFDSTLNAQQRRRVAQSSYQEIAQTFKNEGKTYTAKYDYNNSLAWGVTTLKNKNTFTLSRVDAKGLSHQLLCQLAD